MTEFKQPFDPIRALTELTARVMVPSPGSALAAPWINLGSGSILSINPSVTRDTPDLLRQMADHVEQAWAIMDARQPLNPEEDAAMDGLEARTPVCPLTAALDMVRPRVEG